MYKRVSMMNDSSRLTNTLLAVIVAELVFIAIKVMQIASEVEVISDGSRRPPPPPPPVIKDKETESL